MPLDRWRLVPAVDHEVMALGLAGDRLVDRDLEEAVALGGAHGSAEVSSVVLAETHIERARAGEPHPVAALAEVMGERGDHAEPPAGLAHPIVARGAAGPVIALLERPALVELRPDHRERQILLEPRALAKLAHRHHLDEGEVVDLLAAPADEIVEFPVVDALERDRVDLDRETRALCRGEAATHLPGLAPAGD